MKDTTKTVCIVVVVIAVCLCLAILMIPSAEVNQARGFSLPPGDMEAGAQAFADLNCAECHTVAGSDRFVQIPENPDLHVALGGEVHLVKTYGELVTAIIHPSESIRSEYMKKYVDPAGNSTMPDLTEQMTTRQLIDLVTYLQATSDLVVPEIPANYYPNSSMMP